MTEGYFRTIEKSSVALFRDKGSKFIAYAFPLLSSSDFKEKMAAVKKEHPKATHHCFAYRLGTDGRQFRVNDDGEPPGSAGRPILGQIDSRGLSSILIIVVRYFGGTLLGVPGLINAYKTAAVLVLEESLIVEKPVLIYYRLQFDYTIMNDVMRIIKQFDCVVQHQATELFCKLEIGIPLLKLQNVLNGLKKLKGLELASLNQ